MARKAARTATRTGRRAKSNVVSVDFTDVEVGEGGGFHIDEGEYGMKVVSVEQTTSGNDNEQFAWVFKGTDGAAKGKTFYFYTPLVEQSLWKLRETLEALGQDVPDGPMDVDLDELVDAEGVAAVEDDVYRGKTRSKIAGFVIDAEAAEEDDKTTKGKKAAAAGKGKKLPKLTADEVKEMSEEELEEIVEKYGLECDLSESKTLRRKAAAVTAELEEKEHLDS